MSIRVERPEEMMLKTDMGREKETGKESESEREKKKGTAKERDL